MKETDNVKKRLFDQLDVCLHDLGVYDISAVMPLLYVLVAHHEGHLVSIVGDKSLFSGPQHIQSIQDVDGFESDLLRSIRSSVDESAFHGQPAEIVFRFYSMFNKDVLNEYYRDIIEHIIEFYSYRSGRFSGFVATPNEVAQLMAELISRLQPKHVYDPCAGLCSYALLPQFDGIDFIGQEINHFVKIVADVRINAANKDFNVFNEDMSMRWRDEGIDCLASELPFGYILHDIPVDKDRPKNLEDYVIYEFLRSQSITKTVLVVSNATCFRSGRSSDIRKILCEKNYVETVIKLPVGIYSSTGIGSTILILNKDKKNNHVKFVLAEDCFKSDGKRKLLDTVEILNRLDETDKQKSVSVSTEEVVDKGCVLDPSLYMREKIDLLPGQKLVKFTSIAFIERGIRRYEETRGRILKPEHLFSDITELHTKDINFSEEELNGHPYLKVMGQCIIFNVRADKFYIKQDEAPLFVTPNYTCCKVDDSKCLPEYLAYSIVNAESSRKAAMQGAAMPRINYNNLLIPIYESLESQKQIIQRLYRQGQDELKKKLERLNLLSGESSDLIHNLGVTFTKIGACIANLKKQDASPATDAMNDNVQFALRQINSTGTDYKYVTPKLEKVKVYDLIDSYIKAWHNFGYQTFDVFFSKNHPEHFYNVYMSEDTKIEVDTTLFFTMLDCIFINAHQHGFSKQYTADNKVVVSIEGVTYKGEKYACISISNNGNPLPEGFTVQNFVERGVVGINSSQDGIGGDHVYKIARHFNGLVSIDNDSEWLSFNILIPVYLSSTSNYNDYECECI